MVVWNKTIIVIINFVTMRFNQLYKYTTQPRRVYYILSIGLNFVYFVRIPKESRNSKIYLYTY